MTNNEKNKLPDLTGTSEPEAGIESPELEWAQRNVPAEEDQRKPVKSVFRKTELYGTAPPTAPDAVKKKRKRTIRELRNPVGTVSYSTFETAFADFICSLLESQDIVKEEMLLHVADLHQRIDVLELRLEQDRQAVSGIPREER